MNKQRKLFSNNFKFPGLTTYICIKFMFCCFRNKLSFVHQSQYLIFYWHIQTKTDLNMISFFISFSLKGNLKSNLKTVFLKDIRKSESKKPWTLFKKILNAVAWTIFLTGPVHLSPRAAAGLMQHHALLLVLTVQDIEANIFRR